MKNRTQKFCNIPLIFFQRFDHGAALKTERKQERWVVGPGEYLRFRAWIFQGVPQFWKFRALYLYKDEKI